MIFVGLMIWVPIGLIAPGGAFGEDVSATPEEVSAALAARDAGDSSLFEALPDVNQECECVPSKINDVTFADHTPLAGLPAAVDRRQRAGLAAEHRLSDRRVLRHRSVRVAGMAALPVRAMAGATGSARLAGSLD